MGDNNFHKNSNETRLTVTIDGHKPYEDLVSNISLKLVQEGIALEK